MTKKVNTGLTGAETSLAAALLNAGVKPASDSTVPAPALAPATPTSAATAPNPPAPAPTNPTGADAAITASAQIDSEIAAVKVVWEHVKLAGITKEQFLKLLELDPPKLAFVQQHKKAIFGSKKQQLEDAAQAVVNLNASKGKKKPAKPDEPSGDLRKKTKKVIRGINVAMTRTIGRGLY